MKSYRLEDMTGGWFVGAFNPTAYDTGDVEVAVKNYVAGATEPRHFHRIATEITLILSGQVRMAGQQWSAGDIVVLAPGEPTDFLAITDAVNIVVKSPSALGDKYLS